MTPIRSERVAVVALLLTVTGCTNANRAEPPGEALAVVRLATFPSIGKNAPYYLGLQDGTFASNGVDLRIIDAYEGATELVASGKADIAQDLCATVAAAISEGEELLIIGVRDGVLPAGTVSLESAEVRSPLDYPGKTWGDSVGSVETALMGALGSIHGFRPDDVKFVNVDFEQRLVALIRGQVDMVTGWYGSGYASFKVAAEKQGVPLQFVAWKDYGLDTYGQCYVTTVAEATDNEDALRRFFSANRAAFETALANPGQAIEAAEEMTLRSGTDPDIIAEAWIEASEIFTDVGMRERGYFWVDGDKLMHSLELVDPGAAQQTDAERLYTNEFLEVSGDE